MSSEPALEQSRVEGQPVSLPFPTSWWERIFYGVLITTMPILSFWATDAIKPEWQDGNLDSYIALLLLPEASLLFIILLGFSIISYWFLLLAPNRFAKSFTIRLGIYTGTVLALHYSLLAFTYALGSNGYIAILIWMFVTVFYHWSTKWTAPKGNKLWFVLAVVLLIILVAWFRVLFLVLIFLVIVAPILSFLIAIRAAMWSFENYEIKLTLHRGFGVAAWVVAYIVAWRYDILKMYELYAALPPQPPPDCYIATAAAQGHPRLVGSHMVQRAGGISMRVNGQLQRLKCAELALMVVSPSLHKVLRNIYDVVGKALARRMTNPFVADVAYLLLKPAEWFAAFILKWIVPEIESISRRMYMDLNVPRCSSQKSGDF